MKASDFLTLTAQSIKAAAKMLLQSRPVVKAADRASAPEIIILANGPSLNQTIAEHADRLAATPTLAVNFMANAPQFQQLKPRYYVLADPHFFVGLEHDNVKSLWANIAAVNWPLTLFVPRTRLKIARKLLANSQVHVATYNFVGIEGFAWLESLAFKHGWAMPRPRNVLIPALMAAISAGYTRIYITGADHSWMETIRVTDDNRVVSIQPHFYTDSKAEQMRSATEYRGYRLHQIIDSFRIAFESYHHLQRYAASHKITILNATPNSYIDAFPRSPLSPTPTLP